MHIKRRLTIRTQKLRSQGLRLVQFDVFNERFFRALKDLAVHQRIPLLPAERIQAVFNDHVSKSSASRN